MAPDDRSEMGIATLKHAVEIAYRRYVENLADFAEAHEALASMLAEDAEKGCWIAGGRRKSRLTRKEYPTMGATHALDAGEAVASDRSTALPGWWQGVPPAGRADADAIPRGFDNVGRYVPGVVRPGGSRERLPRSERNESPGRIRILKCRTGQSLRIRIVGFGSDRVANSRRPRRKS